MKDYIVFLICIGIIQGLVFSVTWSGYIMGSSLFFSLLIGGIIFGLNRFRKMEKRKLEEKKQAV